MYTSLNIKVVSIFQIITKHYRSIANNISRKTYFMIMWKIKECVFWMTPVLWTYLLLIIFYGMNSYFLNQSRSKSLLRLDL